MPARSTNFPSVFAPAKPMMRDVFERRPSLTPKTVARSVPPPPVRCHFSRPAMSATGCTSGRCRRAMVRPCSCSSGAMAWAVSSWAMYIS
jgi:hypothetical protein